ncbi:MAG: sulfotransferase [Actinobacteria bacterium]|nr:sulfotransferase [Actinomycetota bacterium]
MTAPLLVTGLHRSGTTWAGRMLCLSGEAGYIHEPFNPTRRPSWSGGRIPLWFQYICAENEAQFEPILNDVLEFRYPLFANLRDPRTLKRLGTLVREYPSAYMSRFRNLRPLLKDPMALFSAEWLADHYGTRVVVMIRHPAAFAGSIKRLNWQFKFKSWLAQDLLLRDWLHPYEEKMREYSTRDVDIIDQAILMYQVMLSVIDRYREAHPTWTFVRHEDLAGSPVDGFRDLYARLGLTWSSQVELGVARYSDSSNPTDPAAWRHGSVRRNSRGAASTWRGRLTVDEIDRLDAGLSSAAEGFYGPADWAT